MKYRDFTGKYAELLLSVEYNNNRYHVYDAINLGRWILSKNGKELAWKNKTDDEMTSAIAAKWAKKWEDQAHAAYQSLSDQIHNLYNEQEEIMNILAQHRSEIPEK